MAHKDLTLADLEEFQQELDRELQEHEITFLLGLMGRPDLIERTVRMEVTKRWLTIDALLMKNKRSDLIH